MDGIESYNHHSKISENLSPACAYKIGIELWKRGMTPDILMLYIGQAAKDKKISERMGAVVAAIDRNVRRNHLRNNIQSLQMLSRAIAAAAHSSGNEINDLTLKLKHIKNILEAQKPGSANFAIANLNEIISRIRKNPALALFLQKASELMTQAKEQELSQKPHSNKILPAVTPSIAM